jgi:hypothetical protein
VAYPVYSAVLFEENSVDDSGTQVLGTPAPGTLWILRFFSATFGSFGGFVGAAVSLQGDDPWLWLASSGQGQIFGVRQQSFTWEGRMVIPADITLYGKSTDGDACDMYGSGYILTTP